MSARVNWFEVVGQDADNLRRFYGQAFGWQFQQLPHADYGMTSPPGGMAGGVGKAADGAGWATFYVEVDDIHAACDAVVAAGGAVLQPPVELPSVWVARVADPEGHAFGLAKEKGMAA